MSYCLNLHCSQPQNPASVKFCLNCQTKLLLKDRYRAIQPLTRTGIGQTFLAVDEQRLKARCVIKQLLPKPEIKSDSKALIKAMELFEQEAIRLREIGEKHPQIPALLAYFEQEQRFYLIEQLIEGKDLWQELKEQGPFNEQQIRQLLGELLPVLQFIHEHQIIHGQIRPSNIIRRKSLPILMKGGKADVVLINFGIDQIFNYPNAYFTGTISTKNYAPIEQLRNGQTYPASDIYSLGVTCIHLLTDLPLEELFDPLIGKWRWRMVLKQRDTDVSDKLAIILEKMLKEWVSERYHSAAHVLKDLNLSQSKLNTSPLFLLQEAVAGPVSMQPIIKNSLNSDTTLIQRNPEGIDSLLITTPPTKNTPLVWKKVNILKGHSRYINSVALSPFGNLLASGSADKTIKLWQLDTGQNLATLTGHMDDICSLAFSPDGQFLASGSLDKTVKLWQVATGQLLWNFTGHTDAVLSVAFNNNGQLLASGSWDKTIKIIHLRTKQILYNLSGHYGGVRAVIFSPDSKIVASGSWDRTIHLWKMANGKILEILEGHLDAVTSLTFSASPLKLISGSEDKTIKIWQFDDSENPNEARSTLAGHSNWVNTLAINNHAPILASGSRDKTIKIWDISSGHLLQTLSGESYTVNAVAFTPDGQTLVTGSEDKTIKIWQQLAVDS